MTSKTLSTLLILLVNILFISAQEPTKWRGGTNGIYDETGLLKEWPAGGPEILWSYEGLGEGHSSPVFANGKIYLSTMIDGEGWIFMFSQDGKVIRKASYGKDFTESYPGSRSSVVVDGDLMYMYSGLGELVCMDSETGDEKWRKKVFEDLDGNNIRWGVNETVLVDGDVVYVTPGGQKNNMVALNRFTGDLIWTSPGKGTLAAYCTPLLVELPARRLLVTHVSDYIIGVDAETGKLLWDYPHPNRYNIHPNTPVYHSGKLFCFSGYGQGAAMLNLSADGSSVEKAWTKPEIDNQMGGVVLVDGYIYGSGHNNREWRCLDWETGKESWVSSELGKGVVIYADGMLYCYSDRGELALAKADPKAFEIVSKTKVEMGTAQHWAHPVINNGRLFVRHGDALIAYKIK